MMMPATTPPIARDDVEATLLEIFRKHLKTDGTTWDASTTMEEAQVDSFDLVELVFEIEDRFGIEISFNANAGAMNELTLGHVAQMVRAGLARSARPAGLGASDPAAKVVAA